MNEILERYRDNKWSDASLVEIVHFLEERHRVINQEKMPRLQKLIDEALQDTKQDRKDIIKSLLEVFNAFKLEKIDHIEREEKILFSYIINLDVYKRSDGAKPQIPESSIENPISQIEYDHEKIEHLLLDSMREIASACLSVSKSAENLKSLCDCMQDIESEFVEHMRLEKEILFPKAIELELSIKYEKR